MKEIQAVFVDCDGVLYDVDLLTYEEMLKAGQKAGEALGLNWSEFNKIREELRNQGFRGFYNVILKLCQKKGVFFEKFAQDMVENLDYSRIAPNPKLLKLLQQVAQKKKLYIFTNNTLPHLEKVFNRLFDCSVNQSGLSVITAESTLKEGHFYPKRMDGVLAGWCQKIGELPQHTLMMDDTDNVIEAAQKEGLQSVKIENAQMTEKILNDLL